MNNHPVEGQMNNNKPKALTPPVLRSRVFIKNRVAFQKVIDDAYQHLPKVKTPLFFNHLIKKLINDACQNIT